MPEDRPENGYWSEGDARWFVSARPELGTIYAKPYLSAGYGIPHWIWAGIDLTGLTTLDMGQVMGGVRLASPILDLSFVGRDTLSYGKPFLTPAAMFTRKSVLDAPGPNARYTVLEAEATAIAPLPYSALVANFIVVDVLDMPRGSYLYEENYRVVIKDPLLFVLRLTPVVRFLREESLKIGVLTEYAFHTGRGHTVFRMGPVAALQLTDHLQIMAGVSLAVSSPDQLGLMLAAYGIAGIRYQWATGERDPQLPWRGEMIP